MKNKILTGLLGAAGSLGVLGSLASCSDNFNPVNDFEGQMIVSVDLDKDVVKSASDRQSAPASRATAETVAAADLSLRLISESGDVTRQWAKASELTGPVSVAVGRYTLEAYYGNINQEGFELPYYFGRSTLSVEENRTTPVTVTAQLANSMVKIETSDMFRTYFADYSITVHSVSGKDLAYGKDETRPLYMTPGLISTTISITKQNGVTATLEPKSFTAKARHSYVLKFDVNSGEAGEGVLTVTYDDLTDLEEIEIDLSDEVINTPVPHLVADGFTTGDNWDITTGKPSEKSAKITAVAPAGLGGLILTTKSAYLASQGWPTEIDLLNGDAATIAKMKSMGLKVAGGENNGKMAQIDLTEVLPTIRYVESADNTSSFSLQARDIYSRIAEAPVSFSVNVAATTLTVTGVDKLAEWATTLGLDIETNTDDLTGLTLQSTNDRGTVDNCPVTSCEPVEGTTNKYHVTATVPSSDKDLTITLTFGYIKQQFIVKHEPADNSTESAENGRISASELNTGDIKLNY